MKTTKGTLSDLLSKEEIEKLIISGIQVGDVFRMHYPLLASKYDFLKGVNRFIDCSDLKVISASRFVLLFGADKAKGKINNEDLSLIKAAVVSYEDASPKLLKRFGLFEK